MIDNLSNARREELNSLVLESLSSPEFDSEASKQVEQQANRIWNEMRKELTDLAKKGKLMTKNVAIIEYLENGRVSVMYQKQLCKQFKMYDIGRKTDFQQVIFRLAILTERYHFNLYPVISRMRGRNVDWCVEFTKANK